MSDDEFDEEVSGDALDELEELDEDLDEDLDVDEDLDDENEELTEELDDEAVVEVDDRPESSTTTTEEEEDEDVLDLDEELHPDDVEAPLDALLQERTAKATLEDEEEGVE